MRTEHPAVRVRALALARLGRQFPSRCLADREDAVHEALCAALEHGHAGQVRTVSGWAARRLLGVTRERGVLRPARSPATSIAGRAFSDPDGEQVDPADWLDSSARVAVIVEPEAALDLERWQGRDWAAEVRRLVGEARAQGLRWCDIAQACGVVTTAPIRWDDGTRTPEDPEAAAVALDDLLRGRAALGARIRAEADARVLRVRAARIALERRERAADAMRSHALVVFVRRRSAGGGSETTAMRAVREALLGRSYDALGAVVGVSKSTLDRWRTGHSTPGAEHLRRLREVATGRPPVAHCGAP
jgi:DNA-binding transcriptional regulator YiaG